MEIPNRLDRPPSIPPAGRGHSCVCAEKLRLDDDGYAASDKGLPTDLDLRRPLQPADACTWGGAPGWRRLKIGLVWQWPSKGIDYPLALRNRQFARWRLLARHGGMDRRHNLALCRRWFNLHLWDVYTHGMLSRYAR